MMRPLPAAAVSALLLGVALGDVTGKRVPAGWLRLLVAAVVGWRLAQLEPAFLAFWAGVALFWGLGFYQGRDAELLLLLFALWPDVWLAAGICLTVSPVVASLLWWRYRGRRRTLWAWWRARLRAGVWRPSPAELAEGEPIAFLFSAVGIAYAWVVGVRWCTA